jgi:hypothetical protein
MKVEPIHALSFVISQGIKQGMKAGITGPAIFFPDSRKSIHSEPTLSDFINSLWIAGTKLWNRLNLRLPQSVNLFVFAALARYLPFPRSIINNNL